jgi:MerR family transcriptional regulator, mercuric resistance operon regulatory protein
MVGSLSIGQLATAAGVQISTIRFYERSGLLQCPNRTSGGHRKYGIDHIQRVLFIRNARELGFTVDQVRNVASVAPGKADECERMRRLAEQHLDRVRNEITELTRKEQLLSALVEKCGNGRGAPCPILSHLEGEPRPILEKVSL